MNFKRMLIVVFALAVAFSLGATQLAAQTQVTGGVSGVVTDPTGAIVPDAKVNLKDNVRGSSRDTKTSKAGTYEFALLDPSNYTITVNATGFAPASRTLDVSLGSPTVVNIGLVITSGGTTVTVTESAPLTQTENGDVGASISKQQVQNVPNPGNDLSAIAQLAPGVVVNTQGGFGNVEAFGLPATSNLFTVNGMDDNDPFLNLNNSGATNLLLGQNEVQEADVVTNGYGGQFGTFSGIQVNYITRSGGNAFHGNANYFWNGRAMNANDWFSNQNGQRRPFTNANQWGAGIGGPIKKDKMFFFFNTEGLRVLIPVPTSAFIPTNEFEVATMRQLTADVSNPNSLVTAATLPFYCQSITITSSIGNFTCPAAIPGSGAGIFNLYNQTVGRDNSLVESGGGCASNTIASFTGACALQFRVVPINFAPEKQVAGRYDWNINSNDRMFVRMQYDQGIQPTATDAINPLFNATSNQPEYQGQLVETHSFGASTTNQLLISATWYSAIFTNNNINKTLAAFPGTLIDGSFSLLGGIDFALPQGRNVTQFQITDDVSKVRGNHTFRFGFKLHRNYVSDHDLATLSSPEIIPFTEDAFMNGGVGTDPNNDTTELVQRFTNNNNVPITLYEVAGYIEDGWKIKSNLTITPSLRVEHASNPICRTGCFGTFFGGPFDQISHDPNQPYNQAIQTGRLVALSGYQNLQWSPRLSFAWSPFGSTATGMLRSNFVVRGGAGIFYDIFPGAIADNAAGNSPLRNTFRVFSDNIAPTEPSNLFADAAASNVAFLSVFQSGGTVADLLAGGFSRPAFLTTDRLVQAPQFQKWNLEIQKGVGVNTSFSVGYYGNHGIHIPIFDNGLNAFGGRNNSFGVPFGVGQLPPTVTDNRFAGVTQVKSMGVSNYNGMVVSVRHNITSGWGQGVLMFNYTYSHAFDTVSNGGFFGFSSNSVSIQNPFNSLNNYGPADYDVRHDMNANYVWQLPVRKALMGHGTSWLVDGWQVSGAVFYRTGLPFSVVDTHRSYSSHNLFGPLYPNPSSGGANVSCNTETAASQTGAGIPCAFTNDFSAVAPGSETGFGNKGLRNLFRGPSYFDTDMTVMKKTKIPGWERGQIGLGLQFFNLFNHPNFTLPDSNLASPTFGQIQGVVSPPTSILGSFLGGDASPRLIQIKATFEF